MTTNRDPEHDLRRLLEADQGDFGPLYHRLSRQEPPRRLDRTVLAEAARAVHDGRVPRSQRWLVGLGSAAGLVMAAGIAWQVNSQLDSRDAAHSTETEAPRASRVISVLPISEPSSPTAAAPPAPAAEAIAPVEEKPKPHPSASRERKAAPQIAAPPPAPAPVAAAPQIVQKTESASAGTAIEVEVTPQQSVAESAVSARKATSDDTVTGAAQGKSLKRTEGISTRAPAPSSSAQLRRNMRLAPQDWLAEITRLKQEGHRQQAIENLLLFRRQYPDWVISDDLRKLSE